MAIHRCSTILIRLLLAAAPTFGAATAATAQSTLFRGAHVFDGVASLGERDVLVRDGRIAAIGRGLSAPAGADVVDAGGHTLLPGLIDAHTHAFGDALAEALVFGVTTELDMFTDAAQARAWKAEQSAGGATGRADIFSAGTLITAPGGHGTQFGMAIPTLTDADSAQAFVDARIAEGSDWIKVVYDDGAHYGLEWPSLSKPMMAATIAAARRRERMALVHISTVAQARDAIDAGAHGLVHLFTDAAAPDALIELTRARGAFVIPTLTVLCSVTGEPGAGALLRDDRFAPYLTPMQRASLAQSFPGTADGAQGYRWAADAVRRLHDAGVPVLAGTDAPNPGTAHGAAMHRELELLVDAGLTPVDALAAATSVPARVFGLLDRGRIADGLRADLLLVHGDPTADILATREIAGVWKAGVRLDRAAAAANVAALSAQATPGAAAATLISDFEDGTLRAATGTEWMLTTDSMAGGGSWARLAVVDGGTARSARALEIAGTISDRVGYAWAGAMWSPGAVPMQPTDVSATEGFSFDALGDGGTYRVLVFAQSRGMTPLMRTFAAPPEWTQVSMPWSAFDIDGSDVMAVMVVAGPQPGAFTIRIDNVRLY